MESGATGMNWLLKRLPLKFIAGVFLLVALIAEVTLAQGEDLQEKLPAEKVEVVLSVTVPESSKEANEALRVFAAGNIEELGKWRPNGLELNKVGDRTFEGSFEAELDREIEFKITQGDWAKVEQSGRGTDIPNRKIRIEKNKVGQPLRIDVKVERWKVAKSKVSSLTGVVDFHRDVGSKYLKEKRTVAVWLPPGYEASTDRLPVLYMLDGQNLMDEATAAFGEEWGVDESLFELIETKKIPPLIVVAVWNSPLRMSEYTFSRDQRVGQGGDGANFLRFLIEELKPFVDDNYRTAKSAEQTWIGGSSLGGLFALYASAKRSDIFGGCLAFSPSLHWDEEHVLTSAANGELKWSRCNIWISMGASEGSSSESQIANVERVERLDKMLREAASESEVTLKIFDGEIATHREPSWRAQFPLAIEHMLSTKK